MSYLVSDAHIISDALNRLENLTVDEYIIAFGAQDEHFYATPHGYHATHLPVEILNGISAGVIKKIQWVSYGSNPDSWFFSYELQSGKESWRCGPNSPVILKRILENRRITPSGTPKLRVQLGSDDSFVFWFWAMWVCHDVPPPLRTDLETMSFNYQRQGAIETGYFSGGPSDIPDNITWHRDNSYYVHTRYDQVWRFQPTMDIYWETLWNQHTEDEGEMAAIMLREIAHVAINPHTPTSENFAFIKTQKTGKEAPFLVHFGPDDMHSRLPEIEPTDNRPLHLTQEMDQITPYQWATSKRAGRPNPKDSWELELKKGERVQIMRECGQDWYIVKNQKGVRGWAHLLWLDFGDTKPHADPHRAYTRFEKDMRRLLVPGQLRSFPPVSDYVELCAKSVCVAVKQSAKLGICIHNLETLLQASGKYSYEWLKEERNVWHPDKFARYCHPEHKEALKVAAQELFVMYGTLMDKCKAGSADPREHARG